jgi:hypothetical protein
MELSTETVLTGVFNYVRKGDIAERMDAGWKFCRDLGAPHGDYSVLMWWCCGNCKEGEPWTKPKTRSSSE